MMNRRKICFVTAFAALSTSADAFLTPYRPFLTPRHPTIPTIAAARSMQQSRLYSSKKNDEGILKKVAKSILPKKWFQSEEEQKAELARQQVKDNVSGGIKELLKDAPLPVRMMGSLVSPLLSRVASDLQEGMAEQQRTVENVLDDARAYLLGDEVALQALGEPIQLGAPFSQSSSTSIINGQKSVNIALQFPVEGSRGSGVAQARANENGISQLVLQVNGRQINVSLSRRGSPSGRVGRNHRTTSRNDDDIIEAEIIEENKKN